MWDDGRRANLLVGRSFRTEENAVFTNRSGLRTKASDWIVAADAQPVRGVSMFARADAVRDIEIIRAEFRPEVNGARPAWIINFRNNSNRHTYDDILLEATYLGADGSVLEMDKLTVKQRLIPGDEQIVGSVDFKSRGPARRGTVKVIGAQVIN